MIRLAIAGFFIPYFQTNKVSYLVDGYKPAINNV